MVCYTENIISHKGPMAFCNSVGTELQFLSIGIRRNDAKTRLQTKNTTNHILSQITVHLICIKFICYAQKEKRNNLDFKMVNCAYPRHCRNIHFKVISFVNLVPLINNHQESYNFRAVEERKKGKKIHWFYFVKFHCIDLWLAEKIIKSLSHQYNWISRKRWPILISCRRGYREDMTHFFLSLVRIRKMPV